MFGQGQGSGPARGSHLEPARVAESPAPLRGVCLTSPARTKCAALLAQQHLKTEPKTAAHSGARLQCVLCAEPLKRRENFSTWSNRGVQIFENRRKLLKVNVYLALWVKGAPQRACTRSVLHTGALARAPARGKSVRLCARHAFCAPDLRTPVTTTANARSSRTGRCGEEHFRWSDESLTSRRTARCRRTA